MFVNSFLYGPVIMFSKANPGDISESWYNETTLNVTVLQLQPRINWCGFQYNNSGTWEDRLNQQIDVNNTAQYRFIVNISSDQGWADIEYINITAWHDNGSEATTYNQSGHHGGNRNMWIQYENTTATGNVGVYRMRWPDDEITIGNWVEANVIDGLGSPGNTECRNITFTFVPGYQIRYAPGPAPAAWDTVAGYNDTWSWNFNITCDDASGYHSWDNPIVGETINEFGVYSYTAIISVGWPTITGNPGDTPAYNDSYISIETRSNGNYSLAVNITNLTHKTNPSYTLANTSILTAGGELSPLTLFPGNAPQYYYNGGGAGYTVAENNDTSKITNDMEWAVNIPMGQYPGDYNASIYYRLRTET